MKNKTTDEKKLNVNVTDILTFLDSDSKEYIDHAINLDVPYVTMKSLINKSDKEKLLILATFVLCYNGNELEEHLNKFRNRIDNRILNGRICDVSLLEFAKLNDKLIVDKLKKYGSRNITDLHDEEYILCLAYILGFENEKYYSAKESLTFIKKFCDHHK